MEKITGFTPGPWALERGEHPYIPGATREYIAAPDGLVAAVVCDDATNDQQDANARLIAAAPDMAREIERLSADNERLRDALATYMDAHHCPGAAGTCEPRNRARAALAKS